MMKFFRRIRQNLLSEGKIGKYLKYALGEIILVVIGILIALQINSWNNSYQLMRKEKQYLEEIRDNLLFDKRSAQRAIKFNNNKIAAIDTIMILLSTTSEDNDYMKYLSDNQRLLAAFPTFEPVRIAFDNIVASNNIDIIRDAELREQLSIYYNYNWERSPQSAARERTREFANILAEKLVGNSHYHRTVRAQLKPFFYAEEKISWPEDYELAINDPNHLEFHNDRESIGLMFTVWSTSVVQNRWIQNAAEDIDALLKKIENID